MVINPENFRPIRLLLITGVVPRRPVGDDVLPDVDRGDHRNAEWIEPEIHRGVPVRDEQRRDDDQTREHRSGDGTTDRSRCVRPSRAARQIWHRLVFGPSLIGSGGPPRRSKSERRSPKCDPAGSPQLRNQNEQFRHADSCQQVCAQKPEREETDVVELALRVEQDREQRAEPEAGEKNHGALPSNDARQHAHEREHKGPPVRLREENVYERGDVRVTHARRERLLERERDPPPRRQQGAYPYRRDHPPRPALGWRTQQIDQNNSDKSEHRGDEVADHADRKQDGGSPSQPACPHPEEDHSQKEQRDREPERIGILARHRRKQIAAVDLVRLIEEEWEREGREESGPRPLEAGQPAECPGRHRKGERSEKGHELECDVPRDDVAPESSEQIGEREVKGE